MPEEKQIRALLAVGDPLACSALRAYIRARRGIVELDAPGPGTGVSAAELVSMSSAKGADLLLLEVDADLSILAELRAKMPSLPVVVMAPTTLDIGFQAAKLGAAQILRLPLEEEDLASKLDAILDDMNTLPPGIPTPFVPVPLYQSVLQDFPNLFRTSPRMVEIRDTIEKVATTSATVLIRGESGVGKEIVARMVYGRSDRKSKPFIKVNCAAIPNELLESELFGFEAGAFTGAHRAKPGKFELADGGTLFLDEIGEMHPALQAKLLHVLQDGEFSRLGAKHDTAVDVRVLCATNKLLEQRVAEGLFREDLFYRINVVTVHIPPLRERRDEIPVLIKYFIDKYSVVYGRTVSPLDAGIMKFLETYHWPGNIRELENLCKRYVIVGRAAQIVRELSAHASDRPWLAVAESAAVEAISPTIEFPVTDEPSLLDIGRRAAWQAEKQAIQSMLGETRWNRREAARRLKVSYKALLNKIKQFEEEDLDQKRKRKAQ